MSIKISELPQASTVNNTDVIPIVQGGTTKKAPAGLIHPTIATDINGTSTNDEIAGAKATYDKINDLNYIFCENSSFLSISMPTAWTPVKIPVDSIKYQSGDGFTLNNGNIIVGSKPKAVEIYIYAKPQQMNTSLTYGITALINGTSLGVVETIPYRADSIPFQKLYIANINEGDIIQLACRGSSANMTFTVGVGVATILIKSLSEVSNTNNTRSLNLTRTANTGELVGIGDRVELADEDVGDSEQVEKQVKQVEEQVKEQVENISTEQTEQKTEGSGDIK